MPWGHVVPFDEVELRNRVSIGDHSRPYGRESVGMASNLIKEALQKLCFLQLAAEVKRTTKNLLKKKKNPLH